MVRGEDIGAIIFGTILLVVGLVSLFVEAIPVICVGALVFGPILIVYGFVMAIYHSVKDAYQPKANYGYRPQYQPQQLPQYSCPYCNRPLGWVQEYQRWYCYNCKRYV